MAVKAELYIITWSPRALRSYNDILGIIEEKFGTTATQRFVRRSIRLLSHVSRDPSMFRASEKNKNKHIVIVTKQTTLYYRIKPKKRQVELLLFWDTRRNPKRLYY